MTFPALFVDVRRNADAVPVSFSIFGLPTLSFRHVSSVIYLYPEDVSPGVNSLT